MFDIVSQEVTKAFGTALAGGQGKACARWLGMWCGWVGMRRRKAQRGRPQPKEALGGFACMHAGAGRCWLRCLKRADAPCQRASLPTPWAAPIPQVSALWTILCRCCPVTLRLLSTAAAAAPAATQSCEVLASGTALTRVSGAVLSPASGTALRLCCAPHSPVPRHDEGRARPTAGLLELLNKCLLLLLLLASAKRLALRNGSQCNLSLSAPVEKQCCSSLQEGAQTSRVEQAPIDDGREEHACRHAKCQLSTAMRSACCTAA